METKLIDDVIFDSAKPYQKLLLDTDQYRRRGHPGLPTEMLIKIFYQDYKERLTQRQIINIINPVRDRIEISRAKSGARWLGILPARVYRK